MIDWYESLVPRSEKNTENRNTQEAICGKWGGIRKEARLRKLAKACKCQGPRDLGRRDSEKRRGNGAKAPIKLKTTSGVGRNARPPGQSFILHQCFRKR
eukprot:10685247-Lingulodinium_polyedra.AAC.1